MKSTKVIKRKDNVVQRYHTKETQEKKSKIVYKNGWTNMLPESWISEKRTAGGLPKYQVDIGYTETQGYWYSIESLGKGDEPEYSQNYATKQEAIAGAKEWMNKHK